MKNTVPPRDSHVLPSGTVAHSHDEHPSGSGVHVCSTPSVGPHCAVQAWPRRHEPPPQANSCDGSQSQNASGPGTHTPPEHSNARPQQALPQLWPSTTQDRPSADARSTGHGSARSMHKTSGHTAGCHRPATQVIAAQPGPPSVGQHSPQTAPSSLQRSPADGSRPHQQTGSGSATAQLQRPSRQSQLIPLPHASLVPLEQRAPSGEQGVPGSAHGSISGGQRSPGHLHVVPSQVQSGDGGLPRQPGQVRRSIVPAGHRQTPPVHTPESPASLPHAATQISELDPEHAASPDASDAPPSPVGTCDAEHAATEQRERRRRARIESDMPRREAPRVPRRSRENAVDRVRRAGPRARSAGVRPRSGSA